jgi:hypothetical protein
MVLVGGERGIRTPGTLTGTAVFKTAALDHSAISPDEQLTPTSILIKLILANKIL